MWRHLLAAVPLLLLAAATTSAPRGPTCEATLPEIKAWLGEHLLDGDAERDQMAQRIDGLLQRYEGDVSPCVSNLWLGRIMLSQVSERRDEAIRLAGEYLALPGIEADPVGVSRVHSVRASVLAEAGRVVEAGQDFAAAVAFVPYLPAGLAAVALRDYASHALVRENWDVAEEAYERAERILTDSLATDPPAMRARLGRLASDRANTLDFRLRLERDPVRRRELAGRLVVEADTTISILAQANAADETRQVIDASYRARALSQRAYGETVLGQSDAADASHAEAVSLVTAEVLDANPYAVIEVWYLKSLIEQLRGNRETAIQAARRARQEAVAIGDTRSEAFALIVEAEMEERAGRLVAAERLFREVAAYRDVEWHLSRFQDWSSAEFGRSQEAYHGLARVLAAQGRSAEAFSVLDGARARALRNLRAHTARQQAQGSEAQARTDSLLGLVRDQRIALLAEGLEPRQRALVELRISQLQEQAGLEDGDVGMLPSLPVEKVQEVLRAQGRSLISYAVGDSSTLAFVVTPDTLVARELPLSWVGIERLMRAAGGPWQPGLPDIATKLDPLHALHEQLIRPLRDVLPDQDGLIIIPNGPLADLPFETLIETPVRPGETVSYLVRRQPISTDLAAALVVGDFERPERAFDTDLLAFGKSRFTGSGTGGERGASGTPLANLPNVLREIAQIRSFVSNRETVLDENATEERFETEAARARIVHVATHASADPAHPLYSRIYLTDDPDAPDDGVIHLFELQDFTLPADLVVLSGCSTAAGQAQAGEGTIGLQYAVRAAGARTSLATLWPVDDSATADVMGAFYAGLAEGLPADRALQLAQVAYLDAHTGAEASPYYWAATVLSGSPAPIPIRAPRPAWPWVAGALALGAGGLAWRARRRPTDA